MLVQADSTKSLRAIDEDLQVATYQLPVAIQAIEKWRYSVFHSTWYNTITRMADTLHHSMVVKLFKY